MTVPQPVYVLHVAVTSTIEVRFVDVLKDDCTVKRVYVGTRPVKRCVMQGCKHV